MDEKERKKKYPTSKYDPDPNCKFCQGTGEKPNRDGTMGACICIYVDHGIAPLVAKGLGLIAREYLYGEEIPDDWADDV